MGHQKRVQLCCSSSPQQQLIHTWLICICGGQRTGRRGSPPSRASRRMHSRCRPCSQRRKMSAWSQTCRIVHSSSTGSSRTRKTQLILRKGMTCRINRSALQLTQNVEGAVILVRPRVLCFESSLHSTHIGSHNWVQCYNTFQQLTYAIQIIDALRDILLNYLQWHILVEGGTNQEA